jgi:hypothetical protein
MNPGIAALGLLETSRKRGVSVLVECDRSHRMHAETRGDRPSSRRCAPLPLRYGPAGDARLGWAGGPRTNAGSTCAGVQHDVVRRRHRSPRAHGGGEPADDGGSTSMHRAASVAIPSGRACGHSEPLTWAEICARYPDEWVCLVEMDRLHPYGFEFRSARVIGHGKTRRPLRAGRPWRARYQVIGHYFTGRVPVRPPRPSFILDDQTRDGIRYRP